MLAFAYAISEGSSLMQRVPQSRALADMTDLHVTSWRGSMFVL